MWSLQKNGTFVGNPIGVFRGGGGQNGTRNNTVGKEGREKYRERRVAG